MDIKGDKLTLNIDSVDLLYLDKHNLISLCHKLVNVIKEKDGEIKDLKVRVLTELEG